MHKNECSKLAQEMRSCPGKICFTSDCYICLTAHFIDSNWVLQKKFYMPPPHSGIALCDKINSLFNSWGVQRKVFTITLDNAAANDVFDVFGGLLRDTLGLNCSLVSGGEFLHVHCCAHILNLIVQEGLKRIDISVDKIHECVKYVKGSQVRKQTFVESVIQTSFESKKSLRQDVPTRWNSTYLILSSAIYYRRAFNHLRLADTNFVHCPSIDEWGQVEKICKFLEEFDSFQSLEFSGNAQKTQLELYLDETKIDRSVKLDVLAFWKAHQFRCPELAQMARDVLTIPISTVASESAFSVGGRILDQYRSAMKPEVVESLVCSGNAQKTQLELYLDETKIDRSVKLDVLAFWKAHQFRCPELAQMARDVLTIPISTVASESAFSVGGRILDQYRSAMKPEVVESLVCCGDWLIGEKGKWFLVCLLYLHFIFVCFNFLLYIYIENIEVGLEDLTENIMNLFITEDVGSNTTTTDNQ
ncbi:hypothetical protein F511_10927 [Dorcoceras hygrometricum]|uniref:HAT C-terminal dimerisation domain-containing protein n=1 Tax=Dorcoceras hygrometricum TaxID=472368 RepID=A0A2Z7CTU4_9LAMI|nr:hypothetical protein F511_10927 [Dorcoceras hygrometricum]